MKEALCQYQDAPCRECVRQILLTRPFKLVQHWEEPGIEIWTYQLDAETLKISEEYGEMYVNGSDNLKNWLLSEVQKRAVPPRYSLDEAREAATRLVESFVANRPDRKQLRHQGTMPDPTVPASSSKYSAAWIAVFNHRIPDGRQLLLAVDLDSGSVMVREP